MRIDEPTLTTVLGLASLVGSAMFFALAAFARQIPGVRYWALGCLAVGFATVIDGPRFIEDWRLASTLFNIPFSVGQAFLLAGTMQFCGRPGATRVLWSMGALAVLLTVAFTFVLPHDRLRIVTLSSYQALINLWTAWVLWKYADAFSRRAFHVASVVAVLQASAAFAQGALIVNSTLAISYASPEFPLANIISWAGAMLNILVGNWMFFLLIMLRLVADLRLAAEQDILTGLLNRRGFRLRIDAILRRGKSNGSAGSIGILILDIDHFKMINDVHGHDIGDKVLVTMGQVLLKMDMAGATPCRWGGEEFCIVVEGATRPGLYELAERVRARFQRETAALMGLPDGKTVSVGIAITRLDARFEMSQLISVADAELYRAKLAGRDRISMACQA